MATKQHSTLTGSDLHTNKVDATTGTELTTPSETIYDARYVKTTGGTITPAANSTTTLKVTKQDGTTQVFDVDTTNGRVGVGTNAPDATMKVVGVVAISNGFDGVGGTYSNRGVSGGSLEIGYDPTNNAGNIVALTENTAWRRLYYRALEHVFNAGAGPTAGALVISSAGTVGIGLGVNAANSLLQVSGPIATGITTTAKTTTYTITTTDSTVLGDTTGGAFTITLPTAVGITGRIYTIKRTSASANNLTLGTTSSQTLDGATTKTLGAQYSSITVQSDNANWQILSTLGTVT